MAELSGGRWPERYGQQLQALSLRRLLAYPSGPPSLRCQAAHATCGMPPAVRSRRLIRCCRGPVASASRPAKRRGHVEAAEPVVLKTISRRLSPPTMAAGGRQPTTSVPACPNCLRLEREIQELREEVAEPRWQLNRNSGSSSLPPSANPPWATLAGEG
jgi:LSD1 subclass zinc finger protein